MDNVVSVGPFSIEVSDRHIYLNPHLPDSYDYVPWNYVGRVIAQNGLEKATLIDVGANVGDSLAHFRRISAAPAVCIEPDPRFFAFLERNADQFRDVTLINKLLAPRHLFGRVAFQSDGGQSGRSEASGEDGWAGQYMTIDEVLSTGAQYILKTDTDGFDHEIVGACLCRSDAIPVLFFEGPTETQIRDGHYDNWRDLFRRLTKAGYSITAFTNRGAPHGYAGTDWRVAVSMIDALHTTMGLGEAMFQYFDFVAVRSDLHVASCRGLRR